MQYNDTTSLTGIVQDIERKTDLGSTYISGDTTRLKDFTALVNQVSRDLWFQIFKSTGNWIYDDNGYTDLPQGITDLVSGTSAYAMPPEALTIKRIEAKDETGQWYELKPISLEQINEAVDEFYSENGQPEYYRLVNNTIEIFPASNYASSGGLKVYFDRGSVDFAYNATTATPGFASPFHYLIPLGTAIQWLKTKNPTNSSLPLYINDYNVGVLNLIKYYQMRNKSKKPIIRRIKEIWS